MSLKERITNTCKQEVAQSPDIFEGMDGDKMAELMLTVLSEETKLQLLEISDEELTKRVRGFLVIESMSHLLDGFTDEQIQQFNEAVKRRPFFKK